MTVGTTPKQNGLGERYCLSIMFVFRVFDSYGFLGGNNVGKIILACDDDIGIPDADVVVLYLAKKFQYGHHNILWRDEYYEGRVERTIPSMEWVNRKPGDKLGPFHPPHYRIELIRRLREDYQIKSPCHPPECD